MVGVGELNEMMEGIVWDSNAAKLVSIRLMPSATESPSTLQRIDRVCQVRDEAPIAYKDLTEVMTNQEDLVEVIHKLRPLMNMKGY